MSTKQKTYHILCIAGCRHDGKSLKPGQVVMSVPRDQAAGLLSSRRCIALTAEQAKAKTAEFQKAEAAAKAKAKTAPANK